LYQVTRVKSRKKELEMMFREIVLLRNSFTLKLMSYRNKKDIMFDIKFKKTVFLSGHGCFGLLCEQIFFFLIQIIAYYASNFVKIFFKMMARL
jgi:hypothetical protein